MSTTAIFAELLVIGIQGVIWIALLLAGVFQIQIPPDGYIVSREWSALATAVALATAYSVGVIIDRLADSAFSIFDREIRRKTLTDQGKGFVSKARMDVLNHGGEMSEFLEYVRSRLRIARATAANSAAGTVALCVFLHRSAHQPTCVVFGVAMMGALASALTFYAWIRISVTYYNRLLDSWDVLHRAPVTSSPNAVQR
jgi:hypothetical protein